MIALPLFLALALPVGILLAFTPLPWIEEILPDMYGLFAFLIFGTLWAVARGGVEVWLLTREDRAAGRSWRSWQTERPEPLFVRKRPDEATIRKIRSMRDGSS